MSHNVELFTYSEKVDKNKVQAELDDYVAHEDWQEGCTGLFHSIRWLEGTVYEDREKAEEAIDRLDRNNYDCLAVKFKCPMPFRDAKLIELNQKCKDTHNEYVNRECAVYADTITSAFIGCKACGSKISRTHLRPRNNCPVCRADLRPEYMLKSIQTAKDRWEKAKKTADEYYKRKSKKEVCWLVKIEYHT